MSEVLEHDGKDTLPVPNNEDKVKKYQAYRDALFAALNRLQISPITKSYTETYTDFSKDKFRTYMKNPKNNEENLREMSRFFYRVSNPYRRLIRYFSDIPLFHWTLNPVFDVNNMPDMDKVMKAYAKQLADLNNLVNPDEFRKIIRNVLIDGVYYGFKYEDKNAIFIHRLEPKYCKIVAVEAGCFDFAFDFSYYKTYPELLEWADPYLQSLYRKYEQDTTNNRWQILDGDKTICIKFDPENLKENIPAFSGIFEPLIDLIDARSLQRVKDEIQNYKLIIQKIPFFDDTKEEDDFKLQVDTAIDYYNRLLAVVPESVGVALSPMETDTIDFVPDDHDDNLVAESMKEVFDDSGTSQMLFNSDKSGSVGLDASIKTDVAYVWGVVESLQRWVNRRLLYNTSKIKFNFEFLRVDIFNKDKAVDRELKLANSGIPNKLRLAATDGMNPLEVLSAQYLENEILELHNKWIPLSTSYTMSGINGDDQTLDDSTDTGGDDSINDGNEQSKDDNKNKDGVGDE